MEKIAANQKRRNIVLAILAGVLVLSIFVLILWALSLLIGVIGSIIVGIVAILAFLRFICYFAVFPGSVRIWRKWLEGYFRREIASQTHNKVGDLKQVIEAIIAKSTLEFSMSDILIQSKRIIWGLNTSFKKLDEQGLISQVQRELWKVFDDLQTSLVEARVLLGAGDENSLWSLMEPSITEDDIAEMIFEDFPENTCGLYIVQ